MSGGLLDRADLGRSLTEAAFEKRAPKRKAQLLEALRALVKEGRSVIVAFEGWDAAGKGGCIKRLISGIDPRTFDVHPIGAPTLEEKSQHYLWRFWRRLPQPGRFAIFDRTWYGRVLVERVEGLAREDEWRRAYDEINGFERHLVREGVVLVKFWLHIDKATQQQRFAERRTDPLRRWKFTPEDERNHARWDDYRAAVEEMLAKTSPRSAPWHVVPSVDKVSARYDVIDTVAATLGRARGK